MQHLAFHTKNELIQLKIKNIYLLFNDVVRNFLMGKFFTKLFTCKYDKMKGIPKELMASTLV
jgi:hypothetical protein